MNHANTASAMRRRIVRLALPNIVSNITVPLLSLVDVGLAGNTAESSTAIGAVAIASVVINTLYWLFGFLRLGTTGFVAQSYGANQVKAINRFFAQGLSLALSIALLLLVAMPLWQGITTLMAQQEVIIGVEAKHYITIAICGAPAAMLLYVLNGWFIGMQNTWVPMVNAIAMNLINIGVSFALVKGANWEVAGLAWGTILAQYAGVLLLITMAYRRYKRVLQFFQWRNMLHLSTLKMHASTHRDLFVRSSLLSAVTLFFIYASTGFGAQVVAANTLLLQFFHIFSYFTDGFAYAGEALTGRYIGMKRYDLLHLLVKQLFLLGIPLALIASLLYALAPLPLLRMLSNDAMVVQYALQWIPYVALIPLCGFAAFLWDGIFVGATYARGLLYSMLVAAASYFAIYYGLKSSLGVDALWLAFDIYLVGRGMVQWFLWRRYGKPKYPLS